MRILGLVSHFCGVVVVRVVCERSSETGMPI